MKTLNRFLLTSVGFLLYVLSYAQDTSAFKIQLQETTLESKHSHTAWRLDYYICTGIAYAKSMGQSVEDFAKFVGKHHDLTYPNDQTLSAAVQTGHYVLTSYPGGKFEIISESDSVILAKSNRPYKKYYKDGPMLGVTIDEFERYLWGHVAIMARKINIDFEYEIKDDEVLLIFSYKE
ncbi:hypothetical protein ACXR6G_05590 [Ancylomarina sp. YFZ004]